MSLTPKQEKFCQEYADLQNIRISQKLSSLVFPKGYGRLYYVYLLVNPLSDEVFYIGKGKGKRAEHHLMENKTGRLSNSKKHKVINQIVESGEKPDIIVFANNLEENEALSLERNLINRFKKHLTNANRGSRTKHEYNQEHAVSTLRRVMPFHSWAQQRPRTEFEKELYLELLIILQEVASGEKKLYDTLRIKSSNGFNCIEID